jgi:hypothetical protein
MSMKKIKSLRQLKRESRGGAEFFISLRFNLRSTKWIEYNRQERAFYVFNYIDGTEQALNQTQLFDEQYTNIGGAINCGWLYKEH